MAGRRAPDRGHRDRRAADPGHFSAGAFGLQLAQFTALASAAAVTNRLRVGTIVLSDDFRHPAIVAHEAASLHLVSGGRFELGLGAGWYQPEYDAAGIGFDPAGQRIGRLEESLSIIRALLSGTEVHHSGTWYRVEGLDLDVLPAPRDSPRLLVGAGGPRMLRLAARHADIVGVLPAPIRSSQDDDDDPADRLPPAFDAKLAVLREAAGDRFSKLEINSFGTFVVTDTRRASTEELIAAARLDRHRRGDRVGDADDLHRQPGSDPGRPDRPPRALRPVLPGRPRERAARAGRNHQRALEPARAGRQRPNARAIRPARSSSVTVVSTSMTGRPSPVASSPEPVGEHRVPLEQVMQGLVRIAGLPGDLEQRAPAGESHPPESWRRAEPDRVAGNGQERPHQAGQQPEALGDHAGGSRSRSSTISPKPSPRNQPNVSSMVSGGRLTHRSSMSMAANSAMNGLSAGVLRRP